MRTRSHGKVGGSRPSSPTPWFSLVTARFIGRGQRSDGSVTAAYHICTTGGSGKEPHVLPHGKRLVKAAVLLDPRRGRGRLRASAPGASPGAMVPHPCGPFAALEGIGGGQIKPGETGACDHVHGTA